MPHWLLTLRLSLRVSDAMACSICAMRPGTTSVPLAPPCAMVKRAHLCKKGTHKLKEKHIENRQQKDRSHKCRKGRAFVHQEAHT